jgi:hypothetical protein
MPQDHLQKRTHRSSFAGRFALVAAAAAFFPVGSSAQVNSHAGYVASVAPYKPIQAFSHIVGSRHFVGYFVAVKDACAVTVITAAADDDRLIETPQRQTIEIPAADRTEVKADQGKALGTGCTADADAIKVVPLEPQSRAVASR